jgi:hypothetical protein
VKVFKHRILVFMMNNLVVSIAGYFVAREQEAGGYEGARPTILQTSSQRRAAEIAKGKEGERREEEAWIAWEMVPRDEFGNPLHAFPPNPLRG